MTDQDKQGLRRLLANNNVDLSAHAVAGNNAAAFGGCEATLGCTNGSGACLFVISCSNNGCGGQSCTNASGNCGGDTCIGSACSGKGCTAYACKSESGGQCPYASPACGGNMCGSAPCQSGA